MKIWLIRHGMTAGNQKKRYIGTTDEPLCDEGRRLLRSSPALPEVEELYVSPLQRCIETAQILYPGMKERIIEDFRECDFGDFENKNYAELSDNEDYQRWVESNATLPFPHGESREEFQERCVHAFEALMRDLSDRNIRDAAIVVHGGTIMSILSKFGKPERAYFDFSVGNGDGFLLEWDGRQCTYQQIDAAER
ncbi:MAG: histidine phosphatase family protein [Eubacteriales bacterium]|nr:histidine phosphatase family protein [Eubacteriales bacterium]